MKTDFGTVFIIDDEQLSRDSIAALMQSMGLSTKVFSSAEEFLDAVTEDSAGCVVCDNRMPGLSGIELHDRLRAAGNHLPFVLITAYADVPLAVRAMRQGVVTLLEKPYRDNELWEVIRAALEHELRHRDRWRIHRRARRQLAQLADDERQLLDCILSGESNKSAADVLNVSIRTIEARRHGLYQKLGVDSLAALVRLVVEIEHADVVALRV